MKKIVLEFPDEKKIEIEEPKDYNSLKEKIEELEKDILCDYRIQYIDEDNDTILITNNEDYSNFLESNSNRINFFGKDNMTNTTTTLTNIDFTNFNKMTRVSETDESENKNNEIINLNNRLKELEKNHKNELENKNKEMINIQSTLKELEKNHNNELEKKNNEITNLNNRLKELENELANKNDEIIKLKNKIENLEKKLLTNNNNTENENRFTEEQSIRIEEFFKDNQYNNKLNEIINFNTSIKKNFEDYLKKEITNACENITKTLYNKNEEILKQKIETLNNMENERKQLFQSLLLPIDKNSIIDNQNKGIIIHKGFTCEFCKMSPIIGIRYKCDGCSLFNLCEKCYKELNSTKEKTHIYNHKFIPRNYSTHYQIINPKNK